MRRAEPCIKQRPGRSGLLARMFLVTVFAIFTLTLCPLSSDAAATLTETMEIACAQSELERLDCAFRFLNGDSLAKAEARVGDQFVAEGHFAPYPEPADTTLMLVLVDTSDPARQPVIEQITTQIDALLAKTAAHHRLGLASFDADLYLLAPFGTSHADIERAANSLRARGRTTELYRNIRDAVQLIARAPGARKALIVFSDGLAEDTAYQHADVIKLAREQGVIIHSVGYASSVAESVGLQTLRRLSDESGGRYVQARLPDYTLPDGFFTELLANTDSGGQVSFHLQKLTLPISPGSAELILDLFTESHRHSVRVPLDLSKIAPENPGPARRLENQAKLSDDEAASLSRPPQSPDASQPGPTREEGPGLSAREYAVAALSIIALLVAGLALVRSRTRASPGQDPKERLALAYLVPQDRTHQNLEITHSPWRIGRGTKNDCVIEDHSVSRVHAEIRINEQGELLLNDLGSMNGVFVNENRVRSIALQQGDNVDIGEVRYTFSRLEDEDVAEQESTVMMRTHAPR